MVLFDQLRGIVRKGDARVKGMRHRGTPPYRPTYGRKDSFFPFARS